MSATTIGLYFTLAAYCLPQPINSMQYQPAISQDDCINQAKPMWYNYHAKANKKKNTLYTYCLTTRKSQLHIYDFVCDEGGACSERSKYCLMESIASSADQHTKAK